MISFRYSVASVQQWMRRRHGRVIEVKILIKSKEIEILQNCAKKLGKRRNHKIKGAASNQRMPTRNPNMETMTRVEICRMMTWPVQKNHAREFTHGRRLPLNLFAS